MNEQDNFEFNFDEKIDDIIGRTSQPETEIDEYEDIVSDSGMNSDEMIFEDISSFSKGKKRKLKGWKKALVISSTSVFLVLAIVGGLLGGAYLYFRSLLDESHYELKSDNLGIESGHIDSNVTNIALFGVDTRDPDDFTGRTDSIMILSLNAKTKKVKIFSIMRDTLVPITDDDDNVSFGKINSAYAKSPECAIRTLNKVFKLDIEEFATVNFYGMIDIIDAVGGIEATITEDELKWHGYDNPNLNNCMDEICIEKGLNAADYYITEAGTQKLNGVQAVAYSRVRHCRSTWGTNDDFGRTDRQRHVMEELFNKAINMSPTKYTNFIKALMPSVITSLDADEIIDLAINMLGSSPTFEQYRIPQIESGKNMLMTQPSGFGSVVYFDIDYAARMIKAAIYKNVTIDEFIEENPIEKNDWYYEMAALYGTGTRPTPNSSSTVSATDDTSSTDLTSSDDTSSGDTSSDLTSSDDTSSEDQTTSDDDTGDNTDDTSSEDQTTSDTPSDDTSSDTSSGDTSSDTSSDVGSGEGDPSEQVPAA